jgi:TM2 domain-containing membrane protein YozV
MLMLVSNRLKDSSAIEARLLDLAHTTDAKLTAAALAYFAPCSIEDAQRVLDDLTVKGTIAMDVEDDGTIVYTMPGRQKFAARPHHVPAPAPLALVPFRPAHAPVRYVPRGASPLLAALLTLFIPGAGHLYAGRILGGIFWFMLVGLGYVLVLPGLILHLFATVSAAHAANRLEEQRQYALAAQAQPYRLAA